MRRGGGIQSLKWEKSLYSLERPTLFGYYGIQALLEKGNYSIFIDKEMRRVIDIENDKHVLRIDIWIDRTTQVAVSIKSMRTILNTFFYGLTINKL